MEYMMILLYCLIYYQYDMGSTVSQIDQELEAAIKAGNLDEVKRCHEAGADLNRLSEERQLKISLLCVAIENGHLHIVKYFVENGVDVNKTYHDDDPRQKHSAVSWIIIAHQFDILKYFVELQGFAKLDHEYQTSFGKSILGRVIDNGPYDIIKFIVESCKYPNCPTIKSLNQMPSIINQHTIIVKYALENGADPNTIDENGNTALINVIDQFVRHKSYVTSEIRLPGHMVKRMIDGTLELVLKKIKLLLSYGAHVNIKNANGHTACEIAGLNQLDQIVEYINEYTAELTKGAI